MLLASLPQWSVWPSTRTAEMSWRACALMTISWSTARFWASMMAPPLGKLMMRGMWTHSSTQLAGTVVAA